MEEKVRQRGQILVQPYWKRMIMLFLGFVLFFSNFVVIAAQESSNNQTVKAGVFFFEGYHMKDDDGNYTGYGIEFLDLVSQYSHLIFDYTGYDRSWDEMLSMLENGEIDIVTSARKTSQREEIFAFSLPIGRNSTILSIQARNTRILSGDYSTYNGMTVGVLTGSSQNQSLVEFAQEKGFSYQVQEYDDAGQLASDLQRGVIDAVLTSNLRRSEDEKTLDTITTDYFYAIVRKGDEALLSEINYAIDQMNINEGDWSNVLFYKYYGNISSSSFAFTERELAYMQAVNSGEKHITVTSSSDREPYSYVEDGQLKGILPEYFDELMEIAGLPYEITVSENQEEYYNLVENGGVDVIIDRRQYGSEENYAGNGFFTDIYLNTSAALVTKEGFDGQIAALAVADLHGHIPMEHHQFKDAEILTYQTQDEALQAVLDGKADAAYIYTYTAQSFVNNHHKDSLNFSIMGSTGIMFRMYVPDSSDHELITILDKCIQQMSDDRINQLIIKYTASAPENVSFTRYMMAHPQVMFLSILLFTAAIGAVIAFYLHSRWSKKLLMTTKRSKQQLEEQFAIVNTLSRDYLNIYTVNIQNATIRIVKLDGYVTPGLQRDSKEEFPYSQTLRRYIEGRVLEADKTYLLEALSLEKVMKKLASNSEYTGMYRVLVDDEIHFFQFTYVPFQTKDKDNSQNDKLLLAGFRNIDEIVRKEQKQKEILREALAEAQHANVAKTTFLNNMSHDIRTPMNAIIGFTSLALGHIDNQEQVENYLEKILTSGKHLLSLINDILDMSRIESGKVQIEERESSLPEIIHDLKTIVQADVKSKQLSFNIDTLDVTNEMIICDKLRLNQVLLNILSNAMKYSKPGGAVSVRIIQTGDAPDGYASYQFRIKDTGIGMSKKFLAHLFEPFEREQTATVSGIQGTGLGLAITKNIVDMMNGTIDVTSEEGVGSEFIVSFCFRVRNEEDVPDEYAEKLMGVRALVVDDDVHVCTSVSKMLSSIGMRPEWTTRGEEAIIRTEFAREQNTPFQVFLIDWLIPDMNGIETARRLRRIVGEDVSIIILTAYDWTDIEAEAKEAGVTAFCSKPLFLSELRKILIAPYRTSMEVEEPDTPEHFFFGKKILLVEDNSLNQEIAKTILEEVGLVIDTADDGTKAVEKMRASGDYDLILMDIQMPVMDGYEAAETIRKMEDPVKAGIPIVAMTANAFEEDRQRAMDAGMNGHVAKPIDIHLLMETLKGILTPNN